MALSAVEEAQLRDLIAQQAALLSLAGVEPTILSKLGAGKVTLSYLPSASVINDADLLLLRQGTTDKSTTASLIKSYIAAAFPVLAEQDYKSSVRLASTANVASISGLLTIDGIVTVAGDRVLLKDQSTAVQNGIYVVAAGAWTRAPDADNGTELNGGAIIPVEEGTVNADTNWQVTNNGAVTIGVTGLAFQLISSTVTATIDPTFLDNSAKSASTSWVRGAMGAIAGAAGFSYSFTANGYIKFPSWFAGFILQWGEATTSAAGSVVVTFPLAYTTGQLRNYISLFTSFVNSPFIVGSDNGSSTQMTITSCTTAGAGVAVTVKWFSIGR